MACVLHVYFILYATHKVKLDVKGKRMKHLLPLIALCLIAVGCGNAVTVQSKDAVSSLVSDSKFVRGPDTPGTPPANARDKIICEDNSNTDFLVLNSKLQGDEMGRSLMMFKKGKSVRNAEMMRASRDLVDVFYEEFSSSNGAQSALKFMHYDIFSNIADIKMIQSLVRNDSAAEYAAAAIEMRLKKFTVSSDGVYLLIATEKGYGVRKTSAPDQEISVWDNIPTNYYSPRWDSANQVVYWDAFDAKTKRFYQAVSFLDGINLNKTIPFMGVALSDAQILGIRLVAETELAWMEWTERKIVLVRKNIATGVINRMELSNAAYAPMFAVIGEKTVVGHDKGLEFISWNGSASVSQSYNLSVLESIKKKRAGGQRVAPWGIEKLTDRDGEVFFTVPEEYGQNHLFKIGVDGLQQRIAQQPCSKPNFFKEAY